MVRYGAMFGPDYTFLGVEKCDLDDPTTFAGADVVIVSRKIENCVAVAKKIESEMVYPGQIKVTVIRESRAIDYAK